ncbi:hypothetical protein PVK06_028840 [Gossypium arboreum]|uniref:RRM domain-containing protein n=1 Tax=Gossypium arboreum TaxID=29729 RepID=A0ABR0P4X0_GOSAR|nr:hypothetical protein PVK06_028840 [Gossypium arboreum]
MKSRGFQITIYHGKVVDAFISEKKSKGGKSFGFVRFSNFSDAQRAISRLNGFVILGSRIWVNIARYKGRRTIWRRVIKQRSLLFIKETNQKSVEDVLRSKEVEEDMEAVQKSNTRERRSEVGDVRFSVSVREKGWSEESKNKFSQKERSQVVANESVSESESAIGLESEKLQNGNRIISTDIIKEKVIENESVGEYCQKMLWKLNEGDHDALNVGILTEDDFGACRLNSGMDRACEGVANMGLALVLGPSGGHDGSVDFDEGLGSLDMEGQHLREGNTLLPDQIYPNNHGIPETKGRGLCQEIEEEFLNTVRGRRKKKQFNKRISSMRVIQDRVLSSKEKQKRDRSRRKEKSSAASRKEDKVVNLSLSNSDISNRRKVILREAKQTWELGKKLGLSVRGDERDVIEDIMRLEDQ